jgi:hypothetical protein
VRNRLPAPGFSPFNRGGGMRVRARPRPISAGRRCRLVRCGGRLAIGARCSSWATNARPRPRLENHRARGQLADPRAAILDAHRPTAVLDQQPTVHASDLRPLRPAGGPTAVASSFTPPSRHRVLPPPPGGRSHRLVACDRRRRPLGSPHRISRRKDVTRLAH